MTNLKINKAFNIITIEGDVKNKIETLESALNYIKEQKGIYSVVMDKNYLGKTVIENLVKTYNFEYTNLITRNQKLELTIFG